MSARDLERVPVPTVARERTMRVMAGVLSGEDATKLAAEVGDEIRAGLQQEHEDDLERARVTSFEIGVRTACRLMRDRELIDEQAEESVLRALDVLG